MTFLSVNGNPINHIEGVTVELLDAEGNIVATTQTDHRGNYRFRQFDRTGSYTIRVATDESLEVVGDGSLEISIGQGDWRMREVDFLVVA